MSFWGFNQCQKEDVNNPTSFQHLQTHRQINDWNLTSANSNCSLLHRLQVWISLICSAARQLFLLKHRHAIMYIQDGGIPQAVRDWGVVRRLSVSEEWFRLAVYSTWNWIWHVHAGHMTEDQPSNTLQYLRADPLVKYFLCLVHQFTFSFIVFVALFFVLLKYPVLLFSLSVTGKFLHLA